MALLTVGYALLFAVAIIFTLLTIVRTSKVSAVWATIAMVCWFGLAGLTLAVFETEPALYVLSYVWYAVAATIEIVGIAISIDNLRADKQDRDLVV